MNVFHLKLLNDEKIILMFNMKKEGRRMSKPLYNIYILFFALQCEGHKALLEQKDCSTLMR